MHHSEMVQSFLAYSGGYWLAGLGRGSSYRHKTDTHLLTCYVGNVNRPWDIGLNANFNLSFLTRKAVAITSKNVKTLHPVMKVGGTKWYWYHGSQFLGATRSTGPIHRVVAPMQRHILAWIHVVWAILRENRLGVWPLGLWGKVRKSSDSPIAIMCHR